MSRLRLLLVLALGLLTACPQPMEETPDEVPPMAQRPSFRTPVVADQIVFPSPVLLAGGTVMTGEGETIEGGYVLMVDGLLEYVGPEQPSQLPPGTETVDVSGRWVTPGLIDTHSHLGVYPTPYVAAHADGNEATAPITAEVDAEHSVWPQDPGFQRAVAGGVTSLQILPGSANLIGGRSATLKLHPGLETADMRFPGAPVGLKMACGENPKRVYGDKGGPSTRMASIARMRAAFADAELLNREWDDYAVAFQKWTEDGASAADMPKPPKYDLQRETLSAVLRDEILVHIHCYRADEMLAQIALAKEFGYSIRSFHHAVEAYKIRDVLAAEQISASLWADWWGFKIEAYDAVPEGAALLEAAGGRPIIHSDSARGIQRLNQEAGKAMFRAIDAGVEITRADALAWITINPAWALGVEEQTGSLKAGKMADVVVWSDDPFSVYSAPDLVFVDGVVEFERTLDSEPMPWSDFEADTNPRLSLPDPGPGIPEGE